MYPYDFEKRELTSNNISNFAIFYNGGRMWRIYVHNHFFDVLIKKSIQMGILSQELTIKILFRHKIQSKSIIAILPNKRKKRVQKIVAKTSGRIKRGTVKVFTKKHINLVN
eukprot:Pompholyxophrys_punicea_v1_NODE_1433_length_722_cov_1.824588.p1 type:complete len:111 gc:universal NODE_1433_length_722_cov_1.824588:170-502(+)